jgi:hypothetical protein
MLLSTFDVCVCDFWLTYLSDYTCEWYSELCNQSINLQSNMYFDKQDTSMDNLSDQED